MAVEAPVEEGPVAGGRPIKSGFKSDAAKTNTKI
jgi:hypothetical protein